MLTTTSAHLQADGLISRKVFPEIPPGRIRTDPIGQKLVPHIASLSAWADEHMPAIKKSRKQYEKTTAPPSVLYS